MNLVRKPDAGNLPVRFDERDLETGPCRSPRQISTLHAKAAMRSSLRARRPLNRRFRASSRAGFQTKDEDSPFLNSFFQTKQMNSPARPDYSDALACIVHKSLKICEQCRLQSDRSRQAGIRNAKRIDVLDGVMPNFQAEIINQLRNSPRFCRPKSAIFQKPSLVEFDL
jgi:hypothetical protein